MSFISNFAKSISKPDSGEPGSEGKGSSGLFDDAKLVAEAAQAQFSNQPEKCDNTKAAGSAANILEAASGYAKLDETKGVGKYVDQAEDYLRNYGKPPAAEASVEKKPPAEADPAPAAEKVAEEKAPPAAEKKEEASEEGYGGLLKAAGGFLGK